MNASPAKPFSIVVLDDVHSSACLVQMILERNLRCKVTICLTAEELYSLSDEEIPDLYLLDIQLADGTGIDVCYKLRQDPLRAEVPVIFLSAHGNPTMRVAALKAGGMDFLDKPFFPEELIARTRMHLNLHAANNRIRRQLQEKQALLRVLGHDLKNPISNAFSILEMAKMFPDKPINIDLALKSCEQAMELISHVARQGSLLEEEDDASALPSIDLAEALAEAVGIMHIAAEKKEIKIRTEAAKGVLFPMDKITFSHSIINNLLSNSIKFSHPNSEILIRAGRKDIGEITGVFIDVKDNGGGIPEDVLKALEENQEILSHKGTLDEEGTGQGMKLVKRYVEKYRGTISIESIIESEDAAASGTCIHLFFPDTPSS